MTWRVCGDEEDIDDVGIDDVDIEISPHDNFSPLIILVILVTNMRSEKDKNCLKQVYSLMSEQPVMFLKLWKPVSQGQENEP